MTNNKRSLPSPRSKGQPDSVAAADSSATTTSNGNGSAAASSTSGIMDVEEFRIVEEPLLENEDDQDEDDETEQILVAKRAKLVHVHSTSSDGSYSTSAGASATAWQAMIGKAIPAIVSIRFSQVSAFDTEGPETSEATGFVVDAELGLILTNRHVGCAGPFVGEAIFHDHEEVEVFPVYRDPIHDFGVLRFDPKKIHFQKVTHIPLAPQNAIIGLEIRVVGNDAGEKLSILAGSISRLDRNAPEYGEMTYNDFNTFYLQAASSTSGGSSGSPVLDIRGNAVALQAGGHTKAATDFFFPLDRVTRALSFIRKGQPVPRGTIQTQFYFRPFDEARRLGLRAETEELVRKQVVNEIGMLVTESVIPDGPAAEFLEEGDVLVAVNGNIITKFVPLAEVLDNSVGHAITLEIERGGEPMSFTISVQDLHAITPDRYIEVGGAKVNNLSYQLARQYCVPCRGVYVCEPAGIFRFDGADYGWIVESIDAYPTPDLDALIEAIKRIPDRQRVPIKYYSIADVHTRSIAIVSMERHWTGFTMAVRNDKTGVWDFTDLGKALPPAPIQTATARFAELDESLGPAASLFRSIVKVGYYMPLRLDGYPKSRKHGAGLVVDAEKGIILVSRNIVPTTLGDISITFADTIIVPGKLLFLHPTHNIGFISYDPKLLGSTPIQSAKLSNAQLIQGHKVNLVALNHNQRPICIETVVTDITSVTIPQSSTPRFRAINFDAITLDTPLAQQCSSGFLADSLGQVQGVWLSFLGERTSNGADNEYHMGISSQEILNPSILNPLRAGKIPQLRGLTVELTPVQMAQARHMGLSQTWLERVEAANPHRRQLFLIRNVETGCQSGTVLRELDLILSIDKTGKGASEGLRHAVTKLHEVGVAADWKETVQVCVLRDKEEVVLTVPTDDLSGVFTETSRVVIWAGAILQEPHRSVRLQSRTLPSQVYVSGRSKGSPSSMYGLVATNWVTHVNGVATPTLDAFLEAVKDLPDNEYVRVKVLSFDNVPCVLSIKINLHYWPTSVLTIDASSDCGWKKTRISKLDSSVE